MMSNSVLGRIIMLALILIFMSIACQAFPSQVRPTTQDVIILPNLAPSSVPTRVCKPQPTKTPTATPNAASLPQISSKSGDIEGGDPELLGLLGDYLNTNNSSITFSPDGKYLADAGTSIKIWDVETQKLSIEMTIPPLYTEGLNMTGVAYSSDGGLLSVSMRYRVDGRDMNHILIWDTQSGELLQDWLQDYAIMVDPRQGEYHRRVNAFAFLPDSTKLAYANRNTIEIRDALTNTLHSSIDLGKEMYATDISIREDGEFIYVFMEWYKYMDFCCNYKWKYRVQIWHINTESFWRDLRFEEVRPFDREMYLVGTRLLDQDNIAGTFTATDLFDDQIQKLPYRLGEKYFNTDASLMFCIHDSVTYSEDRFEIWNTATFRAPFEFKPEFIDDRYSVDDVAFSPDDHLLAIKSDGVISLWNIESKLAP
ncbi:MAG: WD40 repeat domain-containing protein [Anaerolineaceae bacterium]|nr:WD40 repeat domain-containing protein [Anaerolineaceae bacterium]